jgi:hypothetical protein
MEILTDQTAIEPTGGAVPAVTPVITASSLTRGLSPQWHSLRLHHSKKTRPLPNEKRTAFPTRRLLTFAATAAKAPFGGAQTAIHPAPSRASCSFGKGDEVIENIIPRRHNARVFYGRITR